MRSGGSSVLPANVVSSWSLWRLASKASLTVTWVNRDLTSKLTHHFLWLQTYSPEHFYKLL